MLTEAQRTSLRWILGYAAYYINVDTQLEAAMDRLDNRPTDEAKVTALIVLCEGIHAEITNTVRKVAKAIQAGSLTLNAQFTLATLRNEGKGYQHEISNLMAVPIRNGGLFSTGGARSNALVYG